MSYEKYDRFTTESFRVIQGMMQANKGLTKLYHDRMVGFLSEPALDPFSVYAATDEAGLRKRLAKLSIVEIFSVIYGFNLAPTTVDPTEARKEPLINHIVVRVMR